MLSVKDSKPNVSTVALETKELLERPRTGGEAADLWGLKGVQCVCMCMSV